MYVFGKNYKQSSTKTFIITVDPNLNNCLWFYTDFDIEYNKYFDFFVDEPLANMLNLSNDVCYHANIYDLVKSNKYYWSFIMHIQHLLLNCQVPSFHKSFIIDHLNLYLYK